MDFEDAKEKYGVRLIPNQQWYCDVCGEIIDNPSKGMIKWRTRRTETFPSTNYDFIIVHHNTPCDDHHDGRTSWDHIDNRFVGTRALIELLSDLKYGYIGDKDDYVKLYARLLIPYYEEARQYHQEAKSDGYFSGENELTRLLPSTSLEIIKEYGSPRY